MSSSIVLTTQLSPELEQRRRALKTALRFLLGVITSLFGLFIVAYILRSQVSDWEALSEPWQPLAVPVQLLINTGFLVIASVSLEWAKHAVARCASSALRDALFFTGAGSVGFLLGQIQVAWDLTRAGYFAASNPANAFFYLLCGMHALHLLGGLSVWARALLRVLHREKFGQVRISVELCAVYWHYLLGLWVVLFALFYSSPQTYAAIAKFCGF